MVKKTSGKQVKPARARARKPVRSRNKANISDPKLFFYASDGVVVESLEALPKALDRMSEEVYAHHVSSEGNDFSNWIRDVFSMPKLAEAIRSLGKKEAAAKIKTALK